VTVTHTWPQLVAQNRELDPSPEALGALRSSADIADDAHQLRQRMADDGYLFLPGFLERDAVLEAPGRSISRGTVPPPQPT
jgi:hypothetical protein